MNIILIGPMGCGKTTTGPILADRLGMTYLAVDKEAQKKVGVTTTNQIKEKFGVERYRELLTEIISFLSGADGVVVDCGEGIVELGPDKERLLKEAGKVVFLSARPEILWDRIKGSAERVRWLSKQGDPFEVYKRNFESNRKFYSVADLEVDTSGLTQEEVAESVINKLKG